MAPLLVDERLVEDDLAAAIAWLLSDEASYATGTFIDVAGGR